MNDNRHGNEGAINFAPLIGFALGAVVGGAIALLLAPASGAHTRRRLGVAARRVSRDAMQTLEDARESVTDAAGGLGADMKSAIEAGRDAFRHDAETLERRTNSRLAKLVDPPVTGA